MKKKYILLPLISLFCFSSCSGGQNSSSSTSESSSSEQTSSQSEQSSKESSSSDSSSSKEEQSSSEESSGSEEQSYIEDSSEELSSEQSSNEETSSSQDISSEESSSEEIPVDPISIYNENSKFYINSVKENVYALKTYHHIDYDDVPFLDFEELNNALSPIIEKERTFRQIGYDNFVYSTADKAGIMIFNANSDVVTIKNFNSFLDVLGENNGIYGDITQNSVDRYKTSDKTKYITKGKDITIDLGDYGFDMVSQDNHLYVSIGVVSGLIFPSFLSGFSYNGKDFFADSFLRRMNLSTYARSSNYNFSWPLGANECPTAFSKVDNKLERETYRFEGFFGNDDQKEELITMSLFKDGKGTLNGKGGANMHYAIQWKLEDNIIKCVAGQTAMESDDIEDVLGDLVDVWINSEETNYGKKVRSDNMSFETYRELCLALDHSYGLKDEKEISSFDTFFSEKGLKERLLDNDIMVYEDAFCELIMKHFDDIHSSINGGESVYSSSEIRSYLRNKAALYQGDRYKSYYAEVTELGLLRGNSGYIEPYVIEGNTAYLRFQIFSHKASDCFPINHPNYQTENHEDAVKAYSRAHQDNPYKAFAIAFNDFGKMSNIKNIVIDIAGNVGGEIRCAPYLAAFMTIDPSIVIGNQMDGSIIDYHYKVDLNGDGVFGGQGDSFQGKYNFYILGGANFSAGNEFSAMAKNTGFAKIIGRKSAGGSCAVSNRTDISGLTYRVSSMYRLMLKNGDNYISNDGGVDVDLTIPFDNMFNVKKLDEWLGTL